MAISFRTEAIAPIQNKIGKALMVPRLRNMLAQPKSTITLRRLMDEGAIVICNLSKGGLGEGTAHLLGALLTTAIRAGRALARRYPARPSGARSTSTPTSSSPSPPRASRSFSPRRASTRLTLTIAHQYLDQLPERLRAAVFGNVGSMLACRAGAADAPILAEQIGLGGADALLDLPNFAAWARPAANVACRPRRCVSTSLLLRTTRRSSPIGLIDTSRRRFGRPRAEVEARIRAFLAG